MTQKTHAKRIVALVVLALFMASLVPAVFAQERSIPAIDRAGHAVRVSAEESIFFRAATDAEDDMVRYIRAEVGSSVAYDRCVEIVQTQHPGVSQERVRMACRLRAHPLRLEGRAEGLADADADVDVRADADARAGLARRGAAAGQRARIDVEKARARYLTAKKNYAESREEYREEREKFREAKQEHERCKKEDGDCERQRKEMRKQAPKFLFKAASTVLHTLDRVKANVEASGMDEEHKVELLASLDARIDAIVEAQAVIENMDENTPPEEVQAAADTIRDEWKKSRRLLHHAVLRVVDAKLGNVIHRAELLSEKLDRIRARLDAAGKDTAQLDSALEGFNAKLDAAAAAHAEAKAEFAAALAGEDDASVQRAQQLHKEARDALRDARDLLRETVREIRELNGSLAEDEQESPDEPVEQDDDTPEYDQERSESDEQDGGSSADLDADADAGVSAGI